MDKMKNCRIDIKLTLLCILAVSFLTASLTAFLLTCYFSNRQFRTLGNFCEELIRENPSEKQSVFILLKSQSDFDKVTGGENILLSLGYGQWDFFSLNAKLFWLAAAGFFIGITGFLCAFGYQQHKLKERIDALTLYLEKINMGGQGLIFETLEDEFSGLQDEMYKTVTALYQMRDEAVAAKKNFADNLSNIAHQLKTPITAIALSVQMLKNEEASNFTVQIRRQLDRLTRLEEALLLLSRIDAGVLVLNRNNVDVYTLLTLAADNLQELFVENNVQIAIPEMEEVYLNVDMDWTMEAVMNLMKNCMEHTPPGGWIHCSCEQNPLYVQIRIWDEGQGFPKEDLPYLFERFYRGKNEKNEGIGIGLSLTKAIVEMQNGVISAFHTPEGYACFEMRFYHH